MSDLSDLKDEIKKLKTVKEEPYIPAYSEVSDIGKQIGLGFSDILGLPKIGADILRMSMGYEEESPFPSGREIQQFMSDWGMTYKPGEEPETIPARFWRNIGASVIPAVKFLKPGLATVPAMREGLAAFGGAAGGKGLEATDWGKQHPLVARAVGELGGGLALSSVTSLKKITELTPLSWLRKPFKGEWAKKRATKRLGDVASEPEQAQAEFLASGFEELTPAQRTGDRGIAQLRQRVEADIPREAEAGLRQRSDVTRALKEQLVAPKRPSISDVRSFLSNKFSQIAKEAEDSLKNIKRLDDPTAYNKVAKQKVDQAYNLARQKESDIWKSLPVGEKVVPSNITRVYKEELENITAGGDIKEIDSFVREKLGKIARKGKLKGELIGGQFINVKNKDAYPKAIHQFYSRLGRRIRELSETAGQTNRIRILNRLRRAALKDLDISGTGEDYREALRLSRELNEMFTNGSLGKVLGFRRGIATPESMFLDDLLGAGDQKGLEGLQQALKAAPEMTDSIKNLIRSKFAIAAKNETNNRINRNAAQVFLGKYRRVLKAFPDLEMELQNITQKQSKVDDLMGAYDVSDVSPVIRQRSAAGVFLGSDPGDEIERVLKYAKSKGSTTRFLKDLVTEVKKDPTGKAPEGLKNAFISKLMENSRKTGLEDEITGELFISGRAFLKKLDELSGSLIESGMMSEKELDRIRKIGHAFKNIETELIAKPIGALITDRPGVVLDVVARVFGARYGAMAGGPSPGGQIQSAGIGAKFFKWISEKITKDEAKELLIKATRDDSIMKDLLANVKNMTEKEQMTLMKRIVTAAKELGGRAKAAIERTPAPTMAVVPPTISAIKSVEEEQDRESLENRIRMLQ